MVKSAKYLLVASIEAYSGKSATVVGITPQLKARGIATSYGKPLGHYANQVQTQVTEADVQFVRQALELPPECVGQPLVYLSPESVKQHLQQAQPKDYSQMLPQYVQQLAGNLVLLEAPPTLTDGRIFRLSAQEVAQAVDAAILVVVRYDSVLLADRLLAAKHLLGDRLLGVVINDIPDEERSTLETLVKPYLEQQAIAVFGMLPSRPLLHSVSVRELSEQLQAKVLCRRDRLDLMVERLTIGAMNVNSALKYFRKGRHLAVVTGSDRSDLQLAALETSAHCLILTGQVPPQDFVLERAESLEIPILAVEFDTLTTVEIAERTFNQVRLQEPIKVQCVQELMQDYFDFDRLLTALSLEPQVSAG